MAATTKGPRDRIPVSDHRWPSRQSVFTEGTSVDEAIERAAARLRSSRDELEYHVHIAPRAGVRGRLARLALVEARVQPANRPDNPDLPGQGAIITEVLPDSPAAAAGLKVGDIVIEVDGAPIGGRADLAAALHDRAPGDATTIVVLREDDLVEPTAVPIERPEVDGARPQGSRWSDQVPAGPQPTLQPALDQCSSTHRAATKIRVHELAKELGMTNAETVQLCETLGIPVKSHSSSLPQAHADMVRRRAVRDSLTRNEQPEEPEPEMKPRRSTAAVTTAEPATEHVEEPRSFEPTPEPAESPVRTAEPAPSRHEVLLIDGMNLACEGRVGRNPSLRQLLAQIEDLRKLGDTLLVVVDRSLKPSLAPEERSQFERILEDGLEGVRVVETPPGTSADAVLLAEASENQVTVVSNDSFKEWQKAHPWLFDEGRLLGAVQGLAGWRFPERKPVRPRPDQRSGRRTP